MTDAEIIKQKIDIVDYISEFVTVKKAGRNFKALCPFHNEKTPSFVISPDRGSWHCFGACNTGGDVITFLQKWENLEFVEALKILAQRAGVTLTSYTPTDAIRLKDKLYEINHLASEFYHFLLTAHKLGEKSRQYLKDRGIYDETAKTFALGYAPSSWDSLLKFLIKKGYKVDDIYTSGLVIKSSEGRFYDRFRGRLMFTLRDHRGNVIGFSGRLIPENEARLHLPSAKADGGQAKYINTSETPVYIKGNTLYGLDVTKESIKKTNEAILVEGEFDMLTSFQSGVTNVVAIKGSAITEGQVILLKRYSENITIALDSDFAGNEAARRGIEVADKAGLNVKIVELQYGKDPADCIEKAPHLWKKSIKSALPIYDFIINLSFKKYNKNDVLGKKKIGSEVVPFLAKISNSIVQSHYIKYLSRELGVTEDSVETAIVNFQKKKLSPRPSAADPISKKTQRDEILEEYLLSLLIQSNDVKKYFSYAMSILVTGDFNLPSVKRIMEILTLYFKSHEKFDIKEINPVLTPEIAPTFDRAFLLDIVNVLDGDIYSKELSRVVKELKKTALRRRITGLATKVKKLEGENKEEEIRTANEELRKLLSQMNDIDKSSYTKIQ